MSSKGLNLLLIAVLFYCLFVWIGLKKKFRLPQINTVLKATGLSRTGTGTDSFELFQIGLGLKEV